MGSVSVRQPDRDRARSFKNSGSRAHDLTATGIRASGDLSVKLAGLDPMARIISRADRDRPAAFCRCRICGRFTVAGEAWCPRCEAAAETELAIWQAVDDLTEQRVEIPADLANVKLID
jgi:hypothetical protein